MYKKTQGRNIIFLRTQVQEFVGIPPMVHSRFVHFIASCTSKVKEEKKNC